VTKAAALPPEFRTWWDGDTFFVRLPEVLRSEAHVFEPVLSTADARSLAAMVAEHEDGDATRVVLVADPAYHTDSTQRFRNRLIAALADLGTRLAVDVTTDAELSRPAASPSPSPEDSPAPLPPPRGTFTAPVPARRRPGSEGETSSERRPRLA
jgi:hypothetical protein